MVAIDEIEARMQQHYAHGTERNASWHGSVKYLFHGTPQNNEKL